MPKHLSTLGIVLLFTVPHLAGASCRTTFESFHCQVNEITVKPDPVIVKPSTDLKRPWLGPLRAFEISLIGGVAADSMSSWGCFESNPLLRSADGRFGARGLVIKAGISGGGLLVAHLLHRKFPKLEKPLTFVFGGGSAWLHGTAIRNRAVGCLK